MKILLLMASISWKGIVQVTESEWFIDRSISERVEKFERT